MSLADDSRKDGSTGEAAHDSAPNSVRAIDNNGASGAIISGKWLERDDMSRRLIPMFIYSRTKRYKKEQNDHPTREDIYDPSIVQGTGCFRNQKLYDAPQDR